MYRYFFLAKNNIKKQKNDMITFFILSFLATLLIFVSLTFMTGIGKVYDTVKENINGADILFTINDNEDLVYKAEEIIRENVYLDNCEQQDFLWVSGAKYRAKGEKNWVEYPFNFCCYEDECKIQTLSIDASLFKDDEVVVPISLSTAYKIGDYIQIKIGDNIYDFKIVGFNEDNIYCSPMNMGMYKTYVSSKYYETIRFENPQMAPDFKYIKAQITDTARKKNINITDLSDTLTNEYTHWLYQYLEKHPDPDLSINILPADLMKTASMILPLLFVAIVFLFALIILIISIVIINFSVKNFIMNNMRNTAIMEASGYTVSELILVLLCQLLMVAGMGTVLGITLGALLLDKIAVIILITFGLEWNQPISVAVIISVALGIVVLVSLLTLILGREYSKTTVLDALRGGVNTHNYKKNLFAFDKTSFSIPVTLALKGTFGRFRSQLGVIFIMMILTISSVIAFGMADSYGNDEGCVKIAGVDFYDAECTGGQNMSEAIAAMETVKNTHREAFMSFRMCKGVNELNINVRAIEDTSLINGGCVLEGRWPVHPNEIMFASAAADGLDVGVGDVVTIKTNSSEENFIVCGICQGFQNMGMMSYMTLDGASKLTIIPDSTAVVINFKEGVTFEEFEKEFRASYPEDEVVNVVEAVHQTVGTISAGMKLFSYFVTVLTILIVAFVESLIVRTNINKEWRNLGVSKALGFTSKQLITQVILSNMPAILIGVIIGLIVSPAAGSKLMVAAFSVFGFRKVELTVEPLSFVLTAVIIIGVAFVTAAFRGRRIKTLEPVKMIMEE